MAKKRKKKTSKAEQTRTQIRGAFKKTEANRKKRAKARKKKKTY